MFLRLRNPKGRIKHPVIVTAKVAMSTSKQVRDYLLCRQCEKKFDQNGENYVLRQMNNLGTFRLLDRLRVSPKIDFSLTEGIYSGTAVGLDMEKFAYFALSIVWRTEVHTWHSVASGHTVHSANLDVYQEPIRKYLLEESPFPANVTVLVTAATDVRSQNSAYEPTPVLGVPNTGFAFLTCGIHFLVFLGKTYPTALLDMCCFSSARQLIFSRDIDERTQHAYSVLAATTREVGILSRDSK